MRARFEVDAGRIVRYEIRHRPATPTIKQRFAKAIVGCCDYNNTTLLQGARLPLRASTALSTSERRRSEE